MQSNAELDPTAPEKYSAAMRITHWLRALVVLGALGVGLVMVNLLPDEMPLKFETLYPNHKQFGLLALLLTLLQLVLRATSRVPAPSTALAPWEHRLSLITHRALLVLLILVPLMGYSMSSTFTQSDGVPFFFFGMVPELLPKNDAWFEVFQMVHRWLAYTLLGLLLLHIGGALKHRFIDRQPGADVLRRML
ncbi:MAG: cytochrome b/b6 domain-containing protein [Burkholderiales bacterium]